jgi:hypothetical protein
MLTTVVHADNANASDGANHGICRIAATLQQVGTNMTANVALGCYGSKFAMTQYRRGRRSKHSLQSQQACKPPH